MNLNEQILRIKEVMGVINEVDKKKKIDDPKKADYVEADVKEFFETLKNAADNGGLSQQRSSEYTYQKAVETMQIGLTLLGYELPRHGIDGIFGPETANAVTKFVEDSKGGFLSEAVDFVDATGLIGKPGHGTHSAAGWTNNNAWDVAAPVGAEVKSLTSGVVSLFRKGSGGLSKQGVLKIYGDQVVIKSDDGNPDVFYTHIDSVVSKGDKVKAGDLIGTIMQVQGIPSHVHVALSSGNLSNYAKNLPTATGGSKVSKTETTLTKATPEMLNTLIEKLKEKGVKSEEIKTLIDATTSIRSGGGGPIDVSGSWVDITKKLLRKNEGFSPRAKWDENAYRGGYGTDKKVVNGRVEKADANTTWTRAEAEETLEYEIKNTYGRIVANQLGSENWKKLSDPQKAALVSMGYNVGPYFLTVRGYGRKIKNAIENDDMQGAADAILQGPVTGANTGMVYAGLQRRRKEESQIFMS